jgi:Holliday junction resolvase
MNRKAKGSNAERELVHRFWAVQGWAACRIAGSGSMRYPAADVLAAGQGKTLAIECKACAGDTQYLTPEDTEQLRAFAAFFGAEPWVAVRFARTDWEFFHPDVLDESGGALAARKGGGLSLDRLIGPVQGPAL